MNRFNVSVYANMILRSTKEINNEIQIINKYNTGAFITKITFLR